MLLSLPQTHHLLPNVRSELVEKFQQSAKTDSLHSHTGGAIPHL
uniref:AlNc14C1576G12999 protein n=1 Tax=Albugo laibachii Nc14 TaxID=890382 RepID=F0X2S3_9STRA|nr:AlNc14C1576G12999 [Albugo laibachii Nc14]|eukprot:CCA28220.1 AlNc14C1576G12999 [Albugo laibachii Nc14]